MDSLLEAFSEYWKDNLIDGIMEIMAQVFVGMNNQVGTIADNVGQTPSEFMPEVFNLIRTLSENVIMPIAGIILTFIACYELIQLVISHNNLSNFETWILSLLIFVIINGRMIQIYLMVSLAPIPFATFGNKEQSLMGQNYVKSLFALGFQGFLIMVCVGIYAVLIQDIALASADDIAGTLWMALGYTVLLAYTLFKTDDISRSILHAH